MGTYLLGCLAGIIKKDAKNLEACLAVMSRLIDKAKFEYMEARNTAIEEEKEHKMTFEEITKRNKGQFIFTHKIINHLENCINSISRIHKLFSILPEEYKLKYKLNINHFRNSIEHMETRINNSMVGSYAINISSDATEIEIANEKIKIEDIAKEIRFLHEKILSIIIS